MLLKQQKISLVMVVQSMLGRVLDNLKPLRYVYPSPHRLGIPDRLLSLEYRFGIRPFEVNRMAAPVSGAVPGQISRDV